MREGGEGERWDEKEKGENGRLGESSRPSSQGWAPRVLPLSMCSVLLSVLFVCMYILGWGFRLLLFFSFYYPLAIARML